MKPKAPSPIEHGYTLSIAGTAANPIAFTHAEPAAFTTCTCADRPRSGDHHRWLQYRADGDT